MTRKYEGSFVTRDMIKVSKRDFSKLNFPRNENWSYQLALDVTYKNHRTGRELRFGRGVGRNAVGDYCFSKAYPSLRFKLQEKEARDYGFAQCAGGAQFKEEGSKGYTEDEWADWDFVKINNYYVVIFRKLKERTLGKGVTPKPIVLKPKVVKKPSKAELEKKYPTPKKYLKAQAALKRKVKAQESRRLKREKKQRALKRKK